VCQIDVFLCNRIPGDSVANGGLSITLFSSILEARCASTTTSLETPQPIGGFFFFSKWRSKKPYIFFLKELRQ